MKDNKKLIVAAIIFVIAVFALPWLAIKTVFSVF